MGWREKMAGWLFGDVIEGRVQLAVRAVDDRWWGQVGGAGSPLDRSWGERQDELRDTLEAWQVNPLARRIVQIVTDYVVGSGMALHATAGTGGLEEFVQRFWHHRQNRLGERLGMMCDALTRDGELFVVLFPNPADGMSYVRLMPASRITRVVTDEEDYERELGFWEGRPSGEGRFWKGFCNPDLGAEEPVMLHYCINRAVGATRGESDLGPCLVWLRRYRGWLEGRVRVNEVKTKFMWDVTVPEQAVQETRARYATPPREGSVLVHGPEERWQAVHPAIDGGEAVADGQVLRQMIAAGAAVPPHFLSDPGASNYATARESGGPTLRHLAQRQEQFKGMLGDVVTVAVMRAQAGYKVARRPLVRSVEDLGLQWQCVDLTKSDDAELARSALIMTNALVKMREQGWIDDVTAAGLALKFAGEVADPEEVEATVEKVKAEMERMLERRAGERGQGTGGRQIPRNPLRGTRPVDGRAEATPGPVSEVA